MKRAVVPGDRCSFSSEFLDYKSLQERFYDFILTYLLSVICLLFGGFILILSLAVSVFMQQAILTVPCERVDPNGIVSLPVGNTTARIPILANAMEEYVVDIDIHPTVKINIMNTLANPSANRFVSVAGCTTGNCTFESVNGITHSFAGVCGKCFDTSSGIFLWSNSSDLTDPDTTLFINATGGQPSIQLNGLGVLQSSAQYPDDLPMEIPIDPNTEAIFLSSMFNVSIISLTSVGCTLNQTASTRNCSQHFATVPENLDLNNVPVEP